MFVNRKSIIAIIAAVVVVLGAALFISGNGEKVQAWFGGENSSAKANSENSTADLPDGVAIQVNDETISREKLEEQVDQMVQQQAQMFEMQGQEMSEEQKQQLKKRARGQVAKQLVDRTILLSNAKKSGVSVSDKDVEEFLDEQFETKQQREQALKRMGISEDEAHQEIKEMLTIQKYMENEVGEIEVSDEDAREFFEQNRKQFEQPKQVKARHILKETGDGDTAQIKAELEDLKSQAESGDSFGALAREHSEGPSASRGGDLGYFGRKDMVEPFTAEAFEMVPGEIRGPVQTQFGLHLIKVEDVREGEDVSFEAVKEEVKQQIQQRQQQQKAQQVLKRLREEAEIKTAADVNMPPARPQMGPGSRGGQPQPSPSR
ncbi:MAG: peptidylprolyl isomerase [bacterium]